MSKVVPQEKGPAIVMWPPSRCIPYARNARVIPDSAVGKVAASIKEFGFKQPIVVDSEGVIIAGHARLMAAERLGLAEVPVLVADDLTPAQVKAYRLADNRTGQEATWDMELLGIELEDLAGLDIDLSLTVFDAEELLELSSKPGGADRRRRARARARSARHADRRPLAARQAPAALRRLDERG